MNITIFTTITAPAWNFQDQVNKLHLAPRNFEDYPDLLIVAPSELKSLCRRCISAYFKTLKTMFPREKVKNLKNGIYAKKKNSVP